MTDIVERLRSDKWQPSVELELLCAEAAGEIERLRAALTQIARFDDDHALLTTTTLNSWDNFSVKIARAALAHNKETTP